MKPDNQNPDNEPGHAKAHADGNAAFYRAVTGDWGQMSLIKIMGHLRSTSLPEDVIDKTTTAIVEGRNVKYHYLHCWQDKINRWWADGEVESCAALGEQITTDIDEAIAPLAPFEVEQKVLADEVFAHLPKELQEAIQCQPRG